MTKGAFRLPISAGGSLPDPATYCPAAGYIKNPEIYEQPIEIGTPSIEQILLLCSNESPGVVSVKCTTSAGQYTTEVYDTDNNLISSVNTNSGTQYNYYFPIVVFAYYIVKIYPTTGGSNIQSFTTYNPVTNFVYNWPIYQAKFNTPNITSLATAFKSIPKLKEIQFNCTLNYLTSFANTFESGGLLQFIFPTNLPALTTAANMFTNNLSILNIDMYDSNLPELTTMYYFCSSTNGNKLKKFRFPSIGLPKLTTMQQAFYKAAIEGEFIIPEMPLLVTIISSFQYTLNLTSIKWDGYFYSLPGGAFTSVNNYTGATKFQHPKYMATMASSTELNTDFKTFIMPDVCSGTDPGTAWINQQATKEYISGNLDNSLAASNYYVGLGGAYLLRSFNCPKLRCRSLTLMSAPFLTSVIIDYANSNFITAGNVILKGALSKTEIDRIFSELPVMAKTIDVRTNPGYATCDKTIATAKGWTVL